MFNNQQNKFLNSHRPTRRIPILTISPFLFDIWISKFSLSSFFAVKIPIRSQIRKEARKLLKMWIKFPFTTSNRPKIRPIQSLKCDNLSKLMMHCWKIGNFHHKLGGKFWSFMKWNMQKSCSIIMNWLPLDAAALSKCHGGGMGSENSTFMLSIIWNEKSSSNSGKENSSYPNFCWCNLCSEPVAIHGRLVKSFWMSSYSFSFLLRLKLYEDVKIAGVCDDSKSTTNIFE